MSRLGRSRLVVAGSSPPSESMLELMRIPDKDASIYDEVPRRCQSASSYEELAAKLEQSPVDDLARTVCVVMLTAMGISSWRVVDDKHPMRPTWLMWRFPEVYWIFVLDASSFAKLSRDLAGRAMVSLHLIDIEEIDRVGELVARHAEGLRTWFDPAGLRSAAIDADLPDRATQEARSGLVLDEELAFATFNGYLLYRQGIPTWMVPTAAEFFALRGIGRVAEMKDRKFAILEDVELNYADIEEASLPGVIRSVRGPGRPATDADLARMFAERLEHWGIHDELRVFVSSSLVLGEASVVKPMGGLYERGIVERLKLSEPVPGKGKVSSGHSAPGALQAIAECLLVRVRKQRLSDNDSVAAIHGSLLANSAERLLGGQTYAMALECLTLRHAFEAQAECGFPGASDELEVGKRIRQLRRSIYQLVFKASNGREVLRRLMPCAKDSRANWRKLPKRCVQAVSGMLEVLGMLREVFGNHKKLEEEEAVLQSIRWWRLGWFVLQDGVSKRAGEFARGVARRISKRTTRGRFESVDKSPIVLRSIEGLIRVLLSFFFAYFTFVLRPLVLACAIAGWIVLFGFSYQGLAAGLGLSGVDGFGFWDWTRHSAVTFLAMQQGLFGDPKWADAAILADVQSGAFSSFWNITVMEMALGYFHMGLLVAILVQRITRR